MTESRSMDDWRARPKVCKGRTGAANTKRYTGPRIDGTATHMHRPDVEPVECAWCSEPATRLCDTLLRGRDWRGDLGLFDGPTCDSPMCETHADGGTMVFGHGDSGGWTDTIDACPYCRSRPSSETMVISGTLWTERAEAHAERSKRSTT